MKNIKKYPIVSLLIVTLIAACGLSPAKQAETATQAAANSNATQTALAPTATSTSTPSPTPTSTPTATATPTLTPRPENTPTITPTPAPAWWDAIPTLEDFPEGFRLMSEDELSPMQSAAAPGSIAFGFIDDLKTQVVMGLYMPLPSRAEQITFDGMLPDTTNLMAKSTGSSTTPELIPGMEDIGDARYAVTYLTDGGGFNLRWDLILFRRGEVSVYLYDVYPDGDEPAVQIGDLAGKLDQRIAEHTESSSGTNAW